LCEALLNPVVKDYVSKISVALLTLYEGMIVTFANLLRKPTTIQYPDRVETPVSKALPERYRGFLEVDLTTCTACLLCEKACPIECIVINIAKNSEGKRGITEFAIDIGKCMYCGLCVEPCPCGAIRFTSEFEAATGNLSDLVLRFVPENEFVLPAKAKKGEQVNTPERGLIARHAVSEGGRAKYIIQPAVKEDKPQD